jgi:hypothetical protein
MNTQMKTLKPTRRFLRGLFVLMLALGSLIALSAQGQTNYTGAYYFNTFAGNAFGGNGSGSQAILNPPWRESPDTAGQLTEQAVTRVSIS